MKKIKHIFLVFILLISCESRTYDEISDKTFISETITYNRDIKAIVTTNCIGCHSPGVQDFTNYNNVKNNIDNIINRISKPIGDPGKMPQGGSLSQSQIDIFVKWKSDGLKEN